MGLSSLVPQRSAFLVACALLIAFGGNCSAQTPAIDQLRMRLAQNGTVRLRLDGVHVTTDAMGHPAEMKVVDSKISRGSSRILHQGQDVALPAGQSLSVADFGMKKPGKKDELVVLLKIQNAFVPMDFVKPKGEILRMSEPELEDLLSTALILPFPSAPHIQKANVTAGGDPAVDAASGLDFPPARPGLPPLHASHLPAQNCRWVPKISLQLGLEMLVQQCAEGGASPTFSVRGQTFVVQAPGASPEEVFTVESKPADQPITDAIRQQFVAKLAEPDARQSCTPVRDGNETGPRETYKVVATGDYAQQKRFRGEDATAEPCPGVAPDDNVARSFVYISSESKTKFLYMHPQNLWPYDPLSIHFIP